MKICRQCKKEKPLTEFFWRNKQTGVKHHQCKICYTSSRKKTYTIHYLQNKEAYKTRALKSKKKLRSDLVEMINDIKTCPCVDCGNTYIPFAMDFDHVRGSKVENVSVMVNKLFSKRKILEEIAKCEIVCAVCHRIRTYNRLNNIHDGDSW